MIQKSTFRSKATKRMSRLLPPIIGEEKVEEDSMPAEKWSDQIRMMFTRTEES